MNIHTLRRVLAQPWAVTPETLSLFTRLILHPADFAEHRRAAMEAVAAPTGYAPLNYESTMAAREASALPVVQNTSVILAWGILGRGWDSLDRLMFDPIEVDQLVAAVEAAPTENVVIWFRSPGGIVTGIPEAADALRAAGKNKRLYAFTDTLCASAAYWLAAQCETIHATTTAELGSIGVYTAFYDYTAYSERIGVAVEVFKAGRLKAMGLPGTALNEEARELIQSGVDSAYNQFTAAIRRNRDIDSETMQGQTFQGPAAIAANLADKQWRSAAKFFAAVDRGQV